MQTDTLDPQFEIETTFFLLGVVLAMAGVAVAVVYVQDP